MKACHNEIRNNDGLDPAAAFDEMAKVLFCKLYEEKENAKGNRFRLSVFNDSMDRLRVNVVHKIFSDAKSASSYGDLISPGTEITLKDRTLKKIVALLEDYDLSLTAFDVKGEAFEYFLGDTFTGGLGQYFTPRNVVEFMVEAIDPKIGQRIVDPFCGTGGFLIYAFEMVSDKIRLQEFAEEEKARWKQELSDRCLSGCDWTDRTSQACKMNMMVHGDGSSGIYKQDGLRDLPGRIAEGLFDLCLTNPPFGSFESDPEVLNQYELSHGRGSQDRVILAVERCLKLVKPGGWVAIILIDGVLNNKSTKYVREFIKCHSFIRAVISLNAETFEGYGARAKTSVLFLEKKAAPDSGNQEQVFFAVAGNTGYGPTGDPTPGNELPEILLDYRAFRKGEAPSIHPSSCVTAVDDRIDAEFYCDQSGSVVRELSELWAEHQSAQSRAERATKRLTSAENLLKGFETELVRLGDVFERTSDKITINSEETYRLVGVRWWGDGTFIREQKVGRAIKATNLYRLSAGLLIYNRLFAFRGSFAIVPPEHEGCYASNEFPTFRVKDIERNDRFLAKFVVHTLNSPQYLRIVDRKSSGSTKTSRNRFLENFFEDMVIHVPKKSDDLKEAVEILESAGNLRAAQRELATLSEEIRKSVSASIPLQQQ